MNSADDSGGPRGAARKAKGFRRIEHDSTTAWARSGFRSMPCRAAARAITKWMADQFGTPTLAHYRRMYESRGRSWPAVAASPNR